MLITKIYSNALSNKSYCLFFFFIAGCKITVSNSKCKRKGRRSLFKDIMKGSGNASLLLVIILL